MSTACRNRICSRSGCRADDGDRPAQRVVAAGSVVAAGARVVGQRSSARRAARPASRRRSSRCPISSGKVQRLSEFRGRPVLVNFWAVWCPPCRRELAELAELRKSLADTPFEILAINLGDSVERITTFLANYPAPDLPILLDADKTAAAPWHVRGAAGRLCRRSIRHPAARRHRRTRLALARYRTATARVDRRLMRAEQFFPARRVVGRILASRNLLTFSNLPTATSAKSHAI